MMLAPSHADPASTPAKGLARPLWQRWDDLLAALALVAMTLIPLVELALRPLLGRGVENAPVLVQHLGLWLAMAGALAAARRGQLTTLGSSLGQARHAGLRLAGNGLAQGGAAVICGVLAQASWTFVASERPAAQDLAYGVPVWWVQAAMPVGFALLGWRLGGRVVAASHSGWRFFWGLLLPAAGLLAAHRLDGQALPLLPGVLALLLMLLAGSPVFAVLGGLALALFASEALPLASVALSHYQITVNPSLPALPLFTLAGLLLARSAAAQRLGALFTALFGGGVGGTVLASAGLCSAFTAITGGSGVTILALGGLLLPLLRHAGYPEQRSIGLVTSASALGVLLAPSVPLIMYAVLARVPIVDMFLAGVLPALVMVISLLLVGGFLRGGQRADPASRLVSRPDLRLALRLAWAARWELLTPLVAVGSIAAGLATPTEAAALTVAYVLLTQALIHRELGWRPLRACLAECAQLIGAVMLILGMALALTNFLVDAGIPDRAVDWVQAAIPNKHLFLLALCLFLFVAAALMEIYAAIVVLVPLLLPLTRSYGIDPLHFGIIFLAAMEVGFLCPPAGMNLYFASAMFGKSIRYVARAVLPAVAAIFVGTALIALLPELSLALPAWASR
jgi:tripartite ATP-independent transporter DctM subunit